MVSDGNIPAYSGKGLPKAFKPHRRRAHIKLRTAFPLCVHFLGKKQIGPYQVDSVYTVIPPLQAGDPMGSGNSFMPHDGKEIIPVILICNGSAFAAAELQISGTLKFYLKRRKRQYLSVFNLLQKEGFFPGRCQFSFKFKKNCHPLLPETGIQHPLCRKQHQDKKRCQKNDHFENSSAGTGTSFRIL